MSNILRQANALKEAKDTFGVYDEFGWYISPHQWTSVLTDSGTAVAGGVGGVLTLTNSDGTVADNDEAYVYSTVAMFQPAANKPLYAEALVSFTEANVSAANVAFGLASSVAADLIADNGAGLRASGTVVAIYKVDGETVWRCVSRNGSNVTISLSTATAGGSYQQLGIEIVDVLTASATVVFTVNGQLLIDSISGLPIKHTLPLSGIAAASLFAGGKNGSTSLETSLWDYVGCWQAR
ncbi:hypothetical protein VT84_24350 [Gemmata sp. SH-PL17]|uniref:hypothetical protein n=1 Tax=Gemmata sp. SH-PL17 TaxID=1630693 RepID=UPI0004B4D8D2|nr:hypothetical protein [Gemmata sp. SH-PL17]AMV27555.1 hypothetical protein VT84_24350 [Gemmata sp. SH-PL17]